MVTEIKPPVHVQEPAASKAVPFIKEPPFIGSLRIFQTDRLNFMTRLWQQLGSVGGFHLGPFPGVVLFEPHHVQELLIEHADAFDKGEPMHKTFRPIIGNGIFISEGSFHRRQRKIMAPSFQPRNITSYADTMVKYGELAQQGWQDGSVIAVDAAMTTITMSIIGKVLFDADVFTEADELGGAMKTLLHYVGDRLSKIFPIPFSWPTPNNLRTKRAMRLLNSRIQQMIEERRASSVERNDFLSILLRARDEDGNQMDDKQLLDESLTLFGAGHETTASSLTWAWFLLAQNPEAYRKLLHEVDTVLQGRSPTLADLPNLPYCMQVFKESLRLYPPAYMMGRAALHDLEIDGYAIHKGDFVSLVPYVMHRRPDLFPEPERFEPERFEPERENLLPRHAFLPFGAGSRVCIGNHFAMMEGQLLLATLAQRVTFELVPGQQIKANPSKTLALRPDGHVQMVVHRR